MALKHDSYEMLSYKPGIFISTASSILTPRLNNLILDLAYLKKIDLVQYKETFHAIDNLDLKKIWRISEKLTPLFEENKDRPYFYWSNLECFELVKEIQKQITLPTDTDTFIRWKSLICFN